MRSVAPLACLLACCALPPRVDDRSTPVKAYETFRGAIARAEYAREWDCLSDRMRAALGLRHRADWEDARAVVLTQGHIVVKGICLSEVEGEPRTLEDGRVLIELDFPFGQEGRVVLRSGVVLRAWAADSPEPVILQPLGRIQLQRLKDLAPDLEFDGIVVLVPNEDVPADDMQKWIAPELRRRITRFEVATEWTLDDFSAGDETPGSVKQDLDDKTKEP